MKVFAGRELQTYEPSGDDIYIHWNVEKNVKETEQGSFDEWSADEVVVKKTDSRNVVIEKIIASQYSVGAEIATINNRESRPEEYVAYQNFRLLAKELANGLV